MVSSHCVSKVCTLSHLSSMFRRSEMSRAAPSASLTATAVVLVLVRSNLVSESLHVGMNFTRQQAIFESNVSKSPLATPVFVFDIALNLVNPMRSLSGLFDPLATSMRRIFSTFGRCREVPKLLTRLFFSTLRSYVVDIVMGRSPGWWCPFWFIDSTLLRMRYDPPTVSLQNLAANENMVLGKK